MKARDHKFKPHESYTMALCPFGVLDKNNLKHKNKKVNIRLPEKSDLYFKGDSLMSPSKSDLILYSYSEGRKQKMSFKCILGIIKFYIFSDEKIPKSKLKDYRVEEATLMTHDVNISGECVLDMTTGSITMSKDPNKVSSVKHKILNQSQRVTLATQKRNVSGDMFFAVRPGTYKRMTLKVRFKNGKTFYKSLGQHRKEPFKINAGEVRTVYISLIEKPITFTHKALFVHWGNDVVKGEDPINGRVHFHGKPQKFFMGKAITKANDIFLRLPRPSFCFSFSRWFEL